MEAGNPWYLASGVITEEGRQALHEED
jgi:hypothetical protein